MVQVLWYSRRVWFLFFFFFFLFLRLCGGFVHTYILFPVRYVRAHVYMCVCMCVCV